MVEVDDNENVHTVDTVPPPAEGDAYSAATVVREAPSEVLDEIRRRREEKQRANAVAIPPEPAVPTIIVDSEIANAPEPVPAAAAMMEPAAIPTPLTATSSAISSADEITDHGTRSGAHDESWLSALVSPENRSPLIALVVGVLLFAAAAYVLATSGGTH